MTLLSLLVTLIRNTRYSAVAASTILTYDHLITLDREIELIWKARWSTVKFLFFLNRYYILFSTIINDYALFRDTLTDSLCATSALLSFTGLAACVIAEVILQMRLYVLYLLDKKVLAFMATCFIASSTCAAIILGKSLSRMTAISEPIPGIYICISVNVSSSLYFFWVPILVFESLLCVLALARGLRVVYSEQGNFSIGRDLINLLVRDSVLYFLVIFATYVTNLALWATQSGHATEIPMAFTVVMSSVVSSRIILNARWATQKLAVLPKGAEGIIPAIDPHPRPGPVPWAVPRPRAGLNALELRDIIEMRDVRASMEMD